MYTIRELVQRSKEYLERRGVSHPRREAEELLAGVLRRRRLELYFDYDAPLEKREVDRYRSWIERRGKREPLAYIIGEVAFLDLTLRVAPGALIPRHETEVFADLITKALPPTLLEVWDLCTGTGCLGLAVKSRLPQAHVTVSDISSEALAIARRNGESNGLEISYLQGDLLAPFVGKKADVLLCNPPYVTEEEYAALEDEVRLFEPKRALVGGVEFFARLAEELPPFLNDKAKIFFEIGAEQGEKIAKLFAAKYWQQQQCIQDWGGHNRFFFLEYHQNFS